MRYTQSITFGGKIMISVTGLSKKYDSFYALRDFDIEIQDGEIFGLLGANGAGKTTLLNCLTGLLYPTAGEIKFDGLDRNKDSLEIKKNLYYIPDTPFIYPAWTPEKYLKTIGALYEVRQIEIKTRIECLLEEFNISGLLTTPVQFFSRGEFYKLAVCGALITDAEYLFFDEPFASGIDAVGIINLKKHLQIRSRDKNVTVIFSTQMLDVTERISDRIAIIDKGKLVGCGRVNELREQARLESGSLEDVFEQLMENRNTDEQR